MKPKRITYRRCQRKDLVPALRLIMKSLNHLRVKTGKAPMRRRITTAPPLFNHIFSTDPKNFYCAWRGDKIVGFAGALRRGKQWYLAWLFVHPRIQDQGVGRRLIDKIWDHGHGVIHSVATMTYNQQAVGLYSSFGMIPESLMTVMSVNYDQLDLPFTSGVELVENPNQRDLAWIKRFEGEIRGFARPQEWKFWHDRDDYYPLLFCRRGQRIGYSLVNQVGEIAPAGGTTNRNLLAVIAESINWCHDNQGRLKGNQITLCCPAQNDDLYRYLNSMNLRNVEMLLFMSETPYADHSRYLPAMLAIF